MKPGPGCLQIQGNQGENGPDALAALSSAKCTNEDNYHHAEIHARGDRHQHVDHCARL
jgi:predicted molibdopterin-dependent oxidoreductase YjgC